MKKILIMALIAGVMIFVSSTPAFAAPKQMADGNIFDPEYYASNNPDVVAIFGTDENLLYSHYLICGITEGRKPFEEEKPIPKFDAAYYAKTNPDLVKYVGTDAFDLYMHYLILGKNEGRIPCENGTPHMNVLFWDAPIKTEVFSKSPNAEFPYELYKLYDNGTFFYFYTPESDGVMKPQHWYNMGNACGAANQTRFATYSDFSDARIEKWENKREWGDSGFTYNGEKVMVEMRYFSGPIVTYHYK